MDVYSPFLACMNPMLMSDEMLSNIYTKTVASNAGAKTQYVGLPYTTPNNEVLALCASLILEEALELIGAMGFNIKYDGGTLALDMDKLKIGEQIKAANLEEMIDGVMDLRYVATGALVSCGVPDLPHAQLVCRANDEKFPNGEATLDPNNHNKYLKPPGWEHPIHLHSQVCLGYGPEGKPYTMWDVAKHLMWSAYQR